MNDTGLRFIYWTKDDGDGAVTGGSGFGHYAGDWFSGGDASGSYVHSRYDDGYGFEAGMRWAIASAFWRMDDAGGSRFYDGNLQPSSVSRKLKTANYKRQITNDKQITKDKKAKRQTNGKRTANDRSITTIVI